MIDDSYFDISAITYWPRVARQAGREPDGGLAPQGEDPRTISAGGRSRKFSGQASIRPHGGLPPVRLAHSPETRSARRGMGGTTR